MVDKLEKVIKGLKYCIDYGKRIKDICNDVPCEGCPYCKYRDIRVGYGDCIDRLHSDAIDILKAQEPKFVPDIAEAIIGCKPKVKVGHCPSCDALIHETDKFCRKCGQAVKWNE